MEGAWRRVNVVGGAGVEMETMKGCFPDEQGFIDAWLEIEHEVETGRFRHHLI